MPAPDDRVPVAIATLAENAMASVNLTWLLPYGSASERQEDCFLTGGAL